ncbi:hypothetical protein NDU88_003021 [Pleurodeles waltl]|uniref:Uncharacterized protein n=1 Tax=Pleurodeles waltl TaxID=8319 RepID=A0AAV7KUG6_PLEWA|nr:hypothetical protein NDU88_003021 [Pleurodeles waltl]
MPEGPETMVTMQGKKDRSVKDMLAKPPGIKAERETPGSAQQLDKEVGEDEGAPVTRCFLEGLFASLRDVIQAVKRDLLQYLKVMRRELEEVGEKSGVSGGARKRQRWGQGRNAYVQRQLQYKRDPYTDYVCPATGWPQQNSPPGHSA